MHYGATERAMQRLGTMASYYFLATGHVENITSRGDYTKAFAALCEKMLVRDASVAEQVDNEDFTDTHVQTQTDSEQSDDAGTVEQNPPSDRPGPLRRASSSAIVAREIEHETPGCPKHDSSAIFPAHDDSAYLDAMQGSLHDFLHSPTFEPNTTRTSPTPCVLPNSNDPTPQAISTLIGSISPYTTLPSAPALPSHDLISLCADPTFQLPPHHNDVPTTHRIPTLARDKSSLI